MQQSLAELSVALKDVRDAIEPFIQATRPKSSFLAETVGLRAVAVALNSAANQKAGD
jgi:hypothetical protein